MSPRYALPERTRARAPVSFSRAFGWATRAVVCVALARILLGPPAAFAAGTFYVDGSNPACSNSGPGSEAQPYCTISAAVSAQGGPGTVFLVKPGTYREQVTVPVSGAAGSLLVLRALGGPVVVDGSDDLSGTSKWAPYSGNVYLAASVAWSPKQAFVDGARLTPSSASPASLPAGSFRWVSGQGLYANVGGGNPGARQLLAGRRLNGFLLSGRSYVTIDGFTVTRTEDHAIYLNSSCTNVTLSHNVVTFANSVGIQVSGGSALRFEFNSVSDHNDHGIALTAGVTGSTVQDNELCRNANPAVRAANGLYMYGAPGNLIQRNWLHHNQDTGLQIQSESNNCVSIQNRSWNNGDHGFDHLFATGTTDIGNVAYGNYMDGISIEGNCTGTTVTNCIAVDNGLTTNEFDLWVDSGSTPGFVSNYNIFWNSTSQPPIKYISTLYSTIAPYRAASGQDAQSLQADPRFVNAGGGDFHLLAGSPAIDSGNSGAPYWSATDAEGNGRMDDPSTPNTGVGPVAYAERGALEFLTTVSDRPPIVTAPATASVLENAPLTMNVTAADPDGDPIASLTAAGLPAGATFTAGPGNTSGTLSWTPTLGQAGSYTVTFTAANALSGSASTAITVQQPSNQPPVASLLVSPSQTGNAPLAVTADASGSRDPDGTIVSYRFAFGDGSVVGPQASPTATHSYGAGNWNASVTVTDDGGAVHSTSVGIIVAAVPPQPNLVGNPSFEQNTTGWASLSGSALARVPGGFDGGYALRVTGTSTTASFGVDDSPNWVATTAAAGSKYRFSTWVRSVSGSGSVRLRVRETLRGKSSGGPKQSPAVTLSPTWQLVALDFVTKSAGSTLDLQIIDSPLAPNAVFLTDNVSIRNVTGAAVAAAAGVEGTPAAAEGDLAEVAPSRPTLVPSPLRSHASLSFSTVQTGFLEVEILDLAGRRVRRLASATDAPAGTHRLAVDGRGDQGQPLSSGMYFYRIRTPQGATTGRFVITR